MRSFAFAAVGVVLGVSVSAYAQEVPVTDEIKAVCAEAEQRFAEQGGAKETGKVTVLMYKYRFCPPNLTVKVGTTVRWINVDKRTSHSVWLKDAGLAESVRLFNKESHEFTFGAPGTFPYICGPHGVEEKMVGHVTVTP
jgi:plastocyanin